MKAEFKEYLKLIGINEVNYLERIETIIKVHYDICQEEINDIFVDEYIKEDGTRDYDDISLFSNNYNFGAIRFLTEDDFFITKRMKNVTIVRIKKKNYDFKKATESSRLNIEIRHNNDVHGILKASKENCDHLKHIYFKYIAPNIKN